MGIILEIEFEVVRKFWCQGEEFTVGYDPKNGKTKSLDTDNNQRNSINIFGDENDDNSMIK